MTRLLLWGCTLALLAWTAWLWPDVPDRVPVHFGASGDPDRWAERSVLSWFGLSLVGLALTAGLDLVATWARRHPDAPGLNLPNKADILALPPPQREVVMGHVMDLLYATGIACLFALALIQLGMWTTAAGDDGSAWVLAGGIAALVLPLGVLVWGLVRVDAEVKRQQRTSSTPPLPS